MTFCKDSYNLNELSSNFKTNGNWKRETETEKFPSCLVKQINPTFPKKEIRKILHVSTELCFLIQTFEPRGKTQELCLN